MEKFRSIKVWKKAHLLAVAIYAVTKSFPTEEKFGLISQMRRSAVSVPANIVEGSKRKTVKDRGYFCRVSDTSLEELKYYIILCYDLSYINKEQGKQLMEQCREVGRMLNKLTKSL